MTECSVTEQGIDTRERLVALEVETKHIHEDIAHMRAKVDELHTLMHAARGAHWVILGMASLAGFLSGKFGLLITGLFASK